MSQVEQARKTLIEIAVNEIRNIPSYSNFYLDNYYVIAKLGLQRKAKVEGFFETADWNNIQCRNAMIERIKSFLTRYIK